MNTTRKSIIINSLGAAVGLFIFAFGVYLSIQANIGANPWDVLGLGLSRTFGVKFGTATVGLSFAVLAADLLLREHIGIGTVLDALLVGKAVDLFNWLGIVPAQESMLTGIPIMLAGLAVEGFAQVLYMRASLGCGPRDTLLVGLGRRMPKLPLGLISVCILAVVTLAGWLFGGPVGVGTMISAGLCGPIMQLVFRVMRFDATAVKHQGIVGSARVFAAKG